MSATAIHVGQCANLACGESVLSWLDSRYCSRRCRTLDLNPDLARREAFEGTQADRDQLAAAQGLAVPPRRPPLRPVQSWWPG